MVRADRADFVSEVTPAFDRVDGDDQLVWEERELSDITDLLAVRLADQREHSLAVQNIASP